MQTNNWESVAALRDRLYMAVGDALHARLLEMAGVGNLTDVLAKEARVRDVARRCWDARACLERHTVICAGAVARGERARRK